MSFSTALLLVALQTPDTTVTKAALLAADTGDMVGRLDADAVVMVPGQPAYRGAEGAGAFRARYAAPGVRYTWRPLHVIVSSDGRLGCTTGAGQLTLPGDSAPVRHGRYLTCWRRRNDGAWRIVVLARAGESPPDQDVNVPVARWPHSATGPSVGLVGAVETDELFARLALDSGPGPAFGRFAATDGMLLGARPVPPMGPDTIRSRFNGFPADQRLLWAPIRGLGAASGGLAVTVGEATTGPPGGPPVGFSKYVTVWRLEPDGSWRFVFDIGSARPGR